jgi:hypothetical protein
MNGWAIFKDDEAASGAPERFAFRQRANVAQAFGHDAAGGGRNINLTAAGKNCVDRS